MGAPNHREITYGATSCRRTESTSPAECGDRSVDIVAILIASYYDKLNLLPCFAAFHLWITKLNDTS